jgi:hypothetical protein
MYPVDHGVTAVKAKDCEHLISTPHIVTLQLNLPLIYLFLTKTKGINRAYYDSASWPNTETDNHRFSEELFEQETLFSGYLFEDMFIVENIHVFKGQPVTSAIDQRLSLLNSIIDNEYVPDPVIETRKIITKDFIEYEYLRSFMEEHVSRLPYAKHIVGLRFCPLGPGRPIIVNSLTEIKPSFKPEQVKMGVFYKDRHTIVNSPKINTCVFSVKKTDKPDVYELSLQDAAGSLKYYDIACIPNKTVSQLARTLITRQFNRILCEFNHEFKRWTLKAQTNASVNRITDL